MRPLIVFDMDGILTVERSSWRFVHDHFGMDNEDGFNAYMNGEIDDREFMRRDISIWKGINEEVSIDDIRSILSSIRITRDMERSIKRLRETDAYICVISGGLDILLDIIGRDLFHDTFANGLEVDPKGFLTGEGVLRVPLTGKDRVLETIVNERGPFDHSIAVGDSLVDVPLFRVCDSSIAFRPMDDATRNEADVTIHGQSLEPVADHILHLLYDVDKKQAFNG